MCREHHQHSELFQDIYRILDEKYYPCPSMVCVIIDNILAFPQHKLVHVLCCTLISLLSGLGYVLPCSIIVFCIKNLVWIAPPLKNSWYSDASPHHHSFLVPVLVLTGIPTGERCNLDSALLATLLL